MPLFQLNTESNVLSFIFSQMAVLSVMVFFVPSSFMNTASMYLNINANDFKDVDTFVKGRLIRLYPPLLFALVLMVLLIFVATLLDLKALVGFSNGNV